MGGRGSSVAGGSGGARGGGSSASQIKNSSGAPERAVEFLKGRKRVVK